MTTKTLDSHIEITAGIAGGRPRIAGHRIRVQDIAIWHEMLGLSADEIAHDYDLSLADIHAALAYYYDNQPTIDKDIAEDDALVKALREQSPSKLIQKLNG